MMHYVAALYDHLVRSKQTDLADGLPPMLAPFQPHLTSCYLMREVSALTICSACSG